MPKTRKPRFAWCFSHGRLHTFWTDETPWCTATWVWLDGATEADALTFKTTTYGDAQFLHHLPDQAQIVVMKQTRKDQA